jgi:DNA polymerase-3 subunit delta'
MDLARALNCEATDPAACPCGECRQCQRITRGLHADVRVISPETPIESEKPRPGEEERTRRIIRKGHVDDLQHRASLKPFEGRSHVFVIDGADLMQASAANALLKTLEEPEGQVMLVLLTAAPAALPETIVSRCQRIDLRPVPASVIERHLIDHMGTEPALAQTLARAAEGAPGWAIAAARDPTALEGRRQSVMRVLGVLSGTTEERFRYARSLAGAHRKEREAVAGEMAVWLTLLRDVLLTQHGQSHAIANSEFRAEVEAVAGALPASAVASAVRAVRSTLEAVDRNAMVPLVFDVLMLELPVVDPATLPSLAAAPSREEGDDSPDDSQA